MGGSLELSYASFINSSGLYRRGVEGLLEIGYTENFSSQVDLSYFASETDGLDSRIFGLHTIYHMNDATAFGIFITVEDSFCFHTSHYGIEASHTIGRMAYEGYLGVA